MLSVHEGFHNAPKLYGSQVREPGKVTDFGSGLKEGGIVRLLLGTDVIDIKTAF